MAEKGRHSASRKLCCRGYKYEHHFSRRCFDFPHVLRALSCHSIFFLCSALPWSLKQTPRLKPFNSIKRSRIANFNPPARSNHYVTDLLFGRHDHCIRYPRNPLCSTLPTPVSVPWYICLATMEFLSLSVKVQGTFLGTVSYRGAESFQME